MGLVNAAVTAGFSDTVKAVAGAKYAGVVPLMTPGRLCIIWERGRLRELAKIFISYKHDAQPDVRLAAGIVGVLSAKGHTVFIDSQIPVGQEWPTVIEQQLGNAEYLVILISEAAAASEMIVKEVAIAHQLRKKHGLPRLMPVRIAYEAALPYDLGAWLDRIQYAYWRDDQDDQWIYDKILAAISSQALEEPAKWADSPNALAADGNAVSSSASIPPPLPTFDPR
jgi:hypothetical protein